MWDLIVSVPDHCLSFYFTHSSVLHKTLSNWHQMTSHKVTFIDIIGLMTTDTQFQ